MSPTLWTVSNGAVLTVSVLTGPMLAEEALIDLVIALAVKALARLALAKKALAIVMLPADWSAMSEETVYLATVDGRWLLRCDEKGCGCVVERVAAIRVACDDEAASSASMSRGCCCHGTVMPVLPGETQWTVRVMVATMEMITIERPWPDRRYATTSESARGARVPREERGCVADAGDDI